MHTVGVHQENARRWNQYVLEMEERLTRTEELLAARSAEFTGTGFLIHDPDRLSEAEIFGIVRDLNEDVYQIAVDLTEEWEKLESPHTANPMDVDSASQPCAPVLVQLTRNRDPMGLTFLLQSCLNLSKILVIGTHPLLPTTTSSRVVSGGTGECPRPRRIVLIHSTLTRIRAVALKRIETFIQHALCSESACKAEVTSGDMAILLEAPGTVFDGHEDS